MAPPPRALVAVVAQGVAQVLADRLLVAAVRLVRLQVAVVLAPRRVPLPQQPEVAVVRLVRLPQEAEVPALASLLVQGLVASQSLGSR